MSETGSFNTVIGHVDGFVLILGETALSLFSFLILMILFWWTFLSFQNTTAMLSGGKLKYLCLLSLASFFLMSFISAMLINNSVTHHLSLGICKIVYPLYFICYHIGKISIYCLISYRQQAIFNQDLYSQKLAISTLGANIYRIFCIFIPSICWAAFIYLGYDHIEMIPISHTKYCYMKTFDHVFYAQIILAMIGILDAFFRLITLSVFIIKSIQITKYYQRNVKKNAQKRHIVDKLSKLMKKTIVLEIISIICTLLFLVCSAYIFQQLIFFLIIDAVICSFCTILLFQFGDQLYKLICFRCEPYCFCLYCLDRNLHGERLNATEEYHSLVEKNIIHLKVSSSRTKTEKKTDAHSINSVDTKMNKKSTNTPTLGTSTAGLIQKQGVDENNRKNSKKSTVTMLSGFENVEVKELEVTSDRVVANPNYSLVSVSEFL